MHPEHYSSGPDPSNAFSDFGSSKGLWKAIRAQWAILETDFSTPPDRASVKNYPSATLLQHVALLLALHADGRYGTGHVWITVDGLTERLRFAPSSRRKVQRTLRALEHDFGIVEFVKKERDKRGRTYRMCVGWEKAEAQQPADEEKLVANQVTLLRSAYKHARLERYEVGDLGRIRREVMVDLVKFVDRLSVELGESFEEVAYETMDLYMLCKGRDDGELINQLHPFDWIRPYFSKIERQLKRRRRKREVCLPATPLEAAPPLTPAERVRGAQGLLEAIGKGPLKKASG